MTSDGDCFVCQLVSAEVILCNFLSTDRMILSASKGAFYVNTSINDTFAPKGPETFFIFTQLIQHCLVSDQQWSLYSLYTLNIINAGQKYVGLRLIVQYISEKSDYVIFMVLHDTA